MSMVSARVVNELFTQKMASAEERTKASEYGGTYIRDRLREVAFVRSIIPPQRVTRADCQVSPNHDTLVKIVNVEPQSKAMAITFRGQPKARYIRGSKAVLSFFTVASEKFQKAEQELLAYEMPITKIIEENSVKDIQEIEDREFLLHVEAGCQALQTQQNGGTATALNYTNILASAVVEYSIRKGEGARTAGSNTATIYPLQRPDVVNLRKMLDGRRLKADRLLFTEVDWDDILQWTLEDFGDRLQSETAVEGYKYNILLGLNYTRTIKTDILRPGNVYVFTKPEYFGRFYVLNDVKFYIDKIANMISFQAWEDICMGMVNIASSCKLELYSGDANPTTDADSLVSNFIPKSEDDLGAVNNQVDAGLVFPQITPY